MLQAQLRVLSSGQVRSMTVELAQPVRLIPVHTKGRPPSYFIIAGLVFGQVRVLLDIAVAVVGPAVLSCTQLVCCHAHSLCVVIHTSCLPCWCYLDESGVRKSVHYACQLLACLLARCSN